MSFKLREKREMSSNSGDKEKKVSFKQLKQTIFMSNGFIWWEEFILNVSVPLKFIKKKIW